MPTVSDFPARGKITGTQNGKVIFAPSNTNYQLYLDAPTPYTGPVGQLLDVLIRAKARKVYTVPSGGGFISPIFGPPKTIQGRASFIDQTTVVIRAGVPIIVELPTSDDAVDLDEGAIQVGSIVNAIAFAGATIEVLGAAGVKAQAR